VKRRLSHYELGAEARHERLRITAAFDELTSTISQQRGAAHPRHRINQRNTAGVRHCGGDLCRGAGY
jgi:hypothetical protein